MQKNIVPFTSHCLKSIQKATLHQYFQRLVCVSYVFFVILIKVQLAVERDCLDVTWSLAVDLQCSCMEHCSVNDYCTLYTTGGY